MNGTFSRRSHGTRRRSSNRNTSLTKPERVPAMPGSRPLGSDPGRGIHRRADRSPTATSLGSARPREGARQGTVDEGPQLPQGRSRKEVGMHGRHGTIRCRRCPRKGQRLRACGLALTNVVFEAPAARAEDQSDELRFRSPGVCRASASRAAWATQERCLGDEILLNGLSYDPGYGYTLPIGDPLELVVSGAWDHDRRANSVVDLPTSFRFFFGHARQTTSVW